MIGQSKIITWVQNNRDNFPHFIVFVGPRGSGKRTLCKTVSNILSCVYSECEINVGTVREVIDTSYQSQTKVMYCFADADTMRQEAKNAMLKITEEPPENAYFCLTVCDDNSLLDTIKSRAYVFNMENYNEEQLQTFYEISNISGVKKEDEELIAKICTTPGDVIKLASYGTEFYNYVGLVYDNIAEVEPANAFKSASKLALKDDKGYDLALFFKTFVQYCLANIIVGDDDKVIQNCDGIIVTQECLRKVDKLGVNKQQLYDSWVFEIRKRWTKN